MPRPHIEPFVDRDVPFHKFTMPGFPKGMQYKMPRSTRTTARAR